MRYFEIVKPSARHISADTDPREAAPGEPRSGEMRNRWRVGHRKSGGVPEPNQSAVTSAAFITPAFAIAQGSVCPRNRPQPTFSSIIRQTISDACCQSASDGSSVVAIVTSASPEFRTVM